MRVKKPAVQLEHVTVERDFATILKDFTWSARTGENWIVFGPNGAGKTSVLNVMQGYLWPTSGRVTVLGGELGNGVDVRDLRTQISVVSEPVRNMIYEGLTGLEVLVTGARAHLDLFSDPTASELKRARILAKQTQAESLLHKAFAVMSTGERQRLLITRALMPNPRIIILDEPCAGLDLAGREWVLQTIEAIARQPKAPMLLLTTHHVEEVTPSFTHALLVKAGEVFAAGPLNQTFTAKNLSGLFELPVRLNHVHGRWSASALI